MRKLLLAGAIVFVSGCSTAALDRAQLQYASGDAVSALQTLGDGSDIRSRDKLLYWLEKGLILHETEDYESSTRALLKAAAYVDANDYISISSEATALLANDWIRNYKGEYSEQLWVHTYLMMNFLALGRYDSAAVEARRALARISDKESVLQGDYFTRALIGLSFEAAGQVNSAYIEYSKLADQLTEPTPLTPSLYRFARSLGFDDAARRYKKDLPEESKNPGPDSQAMAEVVLFVSTGQLPSKVSGSLFTDYDTRVAFPQYLPDQGLSPYFEVSVDGQRCSCKPIRSNLGQLARNALGSRGIALTARLLARHAAKDALAENIAKKDELAGEVAKILLYVLEEADTRGWRSLPGHLALVRVPFVAGSRDLVIESSAGISQTIDISDLTAGDRRFVPIRAAN